MSAGETTSESPGERSSPDASPSAPRIDLRFADVARLEDIADREHLAEVCRSFFDLFGIPIRVFSSDGALLADAHAEREVCRYVNSLPDGRAACGKLVALVRKVEPPRSDDGNDSVTQPCFTGAVYRVVPIEHDGRRVGRFVIGPYLPAEVREVPRSLLLVDPGIDAERARETLMEMPRVRTETAERLSSHLHNVLDLLIFSGMKSYLTSEMHLASVRESYRQLAERNASLQAAYDKLKELDRLKSNFLATVSHELRTPLTSILGYSEMLASGIAGELAAEQREFVGTIHSKGEHLLRLISSLLDLSKLEQGHLSLHRETVSPAEVVKELAAGIRPSTTKKEVHLVVDAPEGLGTFVADPVRLQQVLGNLAENAIKFTKPGGTITVGVRETEADSDDADGAGAVLMGIPKRAFEFRVQDTGMGIPKDEHAKIFDAFYQVDGSSTREHGGTGLGLSIVKRLVEAHGGTVRVESEVGRGTTFFVTIPDDADAE